MRRELATEHPLIRKHLARGVLVDTNILLLVLIGQTRRSLVSSFKRTRSHGFTTDDFDLLVGTLRSFRRVITTTSIITEISNLGRTGLSRPLRDSFSRTLQAMVKEFDERLISATQAAQSEAFMKLGVTDAGIFDLAREGVLVLTDDAMLSGILEKERLDVLNFNHLRLPDL
ncbi:MAG TPA: hypothetical protein VHZ24_12030 [Pirellulales bacterium]|jgi:hypothetical protein|nr:hypothetical protein [Pirellulales bacterium]